MTKAKGRYYIAGEMNGQRYYFTERRTWSQDARDRIIMDFQTTLRESEALKNPDAAFAIFEEKGA